MTTRATQIPVIPDGPQGRSGTQEPPHSLNTWVPALRFAAAGMTGIGLAFGVVAAAQAQPRPPLLEVPVAIAPGFDAHMLVVNIPPAGNGPLTTAGQAGHRHPASTYAYVSKGAVISRLGDGPEKRFEAGQAWSETPLQPHYIVNASRTEPAQLVVVQITKAGVKVLTEPLPKGLAK